MVLDLSGSVSRVYDMILQFTRSLILGIPATADLFRVAIVTFRNVSRTQFYLNTYQGQDSLLNAAVFQKAGGKTNVQDAIKR